MSDTEYTADVNVTEDITPDVDGGNATSSAVDMDDILLSADVSPDELIDVELYSDEPINTDVRDTVGSSETDHRLLTHRDAPDQHPITAITGLNTSLQNMAASIDSRLTADENGIILLQVETDGHTQRLNLVEGDVVDAAKTATNYVTALSSTGIKLHAEDSATLNYITLDGTDGVKMYKGGVSSAIFSDSAVRIGAESESHINIDESGIEIFKDGASASTFGDTTRIGFQDNAHLELDVGGITGTSADGSPYFSIKEGVDGYLYTYEDFSSTFNYTYAEDELNLKTSGTASACGKYTSLAIGDKFRFRVDYYAVRTEGNKNVTFCYSSQNVEFTKGTVDTTSNNYIVYQYRYGDSPVPANLNYIYVRQGYPTLPANDSTYTYSYYGRKYIYGSRSLARFPFYKFGVDVAETGGAASFVTGLGTQADYDNQFAAGAYNTSSLGMLFMVGNGSSDSVRSNALALDNLGNLTIAGTLTQLSDRRLKEHINYLGEDASEFIRELKPVHFIKDSAHHVGFYAQDVEAADKWNCMTDEMNGFKTLGYTELIAPLVAYCQSLEKRIEELERN